jgi:hypothetical protein
MIGAPADSMARVASSIMASWVVFRDLLASFRDADSSGQTLLVKAMSLILLAQTACMVTHSVAGAANKVSRLKQAVHMDMHVHVHVHVHVHGLRPQYGRRQNHGPRLHRLHRDCECC